VLFSSEGVRQGDPLGPLLFSVGVRNTLERLAAHLGDGHALLAYLDDVYVLAEDEGVLGRVMSFFNEDTGASLSLNDRKCSESSFSDIAQGGLMVLGTCVGSSAARQQFLASKVEGQLPALERLAELPGQEALLLLRSCLQANLRHLQRSLRTDDLVDPWTSLDDAILGRLLAIRSSPRRLPTDAGLCSLPARLGGVGLLSHEEVSPHARAAMAESADLQLRLAFAHLNPGDEADADQAQPLSQRSRCQAAFVVRREALLVDLSAAERATVLDNSSPISRRWLAAIPFGPNLKLSSTEVAAGLHVRTLCPGQGDTCSHCSLPNVVGHDDLCSARPLWRIARHEQVKLLLSKHLSAIPGTTVKLEPFVPGSHLRTDLQVTGPGSYNGPVSELDVAIISAASLAARSPLVAPDPSEHHSMTAAAAEALSHQLSSTESTKHAKYDGRTSSPFFPFVLSSAGTAAPSSALLLSHWQSLMPSFNLFTLSLSLSLLRARARFFAF
jgi:hypothetical protein